MYYKWFDHIGFLHFSEIWNRGFGSSGKRQSGFWFIGEFVIGVLVRRGFCYRAFDLSGFCYRANGHRAFGYRPYVVYPMIPSLHTLLFPVVYPKVPYLAHSFSLSIQLLLARWSQKIPSNIICMLMTPSCTSLSLLQILLYLLKH